MTSKTGAAVAAIFAAASVPALALEAPQVNGPWRNPQGGSCDAPYFVGTPGAATQRNEEAVRAVVNNAGTEVTGLLILMGARRGQLVSEMTDQAIFLVDAQPDDKIRFMAIGAPALGWPTVTLERCPQ